MSIFEVYSASALFARIEIQVNEKKRANRISGMKSMNDVGRKIQRYWIFHYVLQYSVSD